MHLSVPSHIIPTMAILNVVLLLALQAEPLPVQIHRMLRAGDAYNAGLVMESFGEPRTISTRYLEVSNYLYWTAKDLPAVVTFAQQGIDLGVANAREVRNTNSQLSTLSRFRPPRWLTILLLSPGPVGTNPASRSLRTSSRRGFNPRNWRFN